MGPKISVVGAGAVGGFLAAVLARSGLEVSVVARGAQLTAIRRQGLGLTSTAGLGSFTAHVHAVEDMAELGRQDVIFIALKAHDVPGIAHSISNLVTAETLVVPVLNGIPWWYFHGLADSADRTPIACLDPTGEAARHIDPESIIGCVVHIAASVPEPGFVRHTYGRRFILGEPGGQMSGRLVALCASMRAAGLDIIASPRIRDSIWTKLMGNISTNPLSALTHGSLADLCKSPAMLALMRELSRECMAVGIKHGIEFTLDIDANIANSRALGHAKPSMLQDLEKGRPMEVPAILQSVMELARRVDIKTPVLDIVAALVSERAKHLGQEKSDGRL